MKIEYNIYCLIVLFLVNLAETCPGQISHKKGNKIICIKKMKLILEPSSFLLIIPVLLYEWRYC